MRKCETDAIKAIAEATKKRFTNLTVTETIDFAVAILDALTAAKITLTPPQNGQVE